MQSGTVKYTSTQLRIWNELATIILIAVVFLITKRDEISWLWGTIGIVSVALIMMISIKIYKRIRTKSQ